MYNLKERRCIIGYTHYSSRIPELDGKKFTAFAKDCMELCRAAGVRIAYEYDNIDQPPEFTSDMVHFNGIGEDGHETFCMPRHRQPHWEGDDPDENGMLFDFCKTACKPYDLSVTACLIAAGHHFGGDISLSSDGNNEDWAAAAELCQDTVGYGEGFKIQ